MRKQGLHSRGVGVRRTPGLRGRRRGRAGVRSGRGAGGRAGGGQPTPPPRQAAAPAPSADHHG